MGLVFLVEATMSAWRSMAAVGLMAGVGLVCSAGCGDLGRQNAGESAQSEVPAVARAPAKQPRLVVDETNHTFETLNPTDPCHYDFVVRNEGDAPLKLTLGGLSCNCLVSEIPEKPIPPGDEAKVRVGAKTSQVEGEFAHRATILTNDPTCKRLVLTIRGVVRRYLVADPPAIIVPEISIDTPTWAKTIVFSQVWDQWEVESVKPMPPSLQWKIEPASRDALASLQAKRGYRIDVMLPPDLPTGSFSGALELSVRVGNEGQKRSLRVPIEGQVPKLRTVWGEAVDVFGVIDIGTLRLGEGSRKAVLLKVRGKHRQLKIERVDKTPEFLQVRVTPLSNPGLYRIEVEVPPDAPPCDYQGKGEDAMGWFRILTDHPQMPEILALKVAFAVRSEMEFPSRKAP
jgi:hypothetical protein